MAGSDRYSASLQSVLHLALPSHLTSNYHVHVCVTVPPEFFQTKLQNALSSKNETWRPSHVKHFPEISSADVGNSYASFLLMYVG